MERGKSQPRRCAIYTRKSSEEGLEQDFPARPARGVRGVHQESGHRGLRLVKTAYDDGGLSGGTMSVRPCGGCWPTSASGSSMS
jgi:hypothetical protein